MFLKKQKQENRDIKKEEDDLAKNRQIIETIIQNLDDGLIIYDTNFQILNFNPAAEKILRLKALEVIGRKIEPSLNQSSELKNLTQVIFPSLAPSVRQISEEGWPQITEITLEKPPLKLRLLLNRIFDEKGNQIGFLKIIQDKTQEENILKSKNEFIAIAAHQLRTPLTAVYWSLENLVKSLNDKSDLKETAVNGLEAAERAIKTANDLLDVAKIEEGGSDYNFQEINLTELIEEVIKQTKIIAETYKIKIVFDPPQEKFIAKIDPQRFGTALFNLVDNAIRYNTKNGSVFISLKPSPNYGSVIIKVEDTGIGIQKEDVEKLFQKFYRAKNALEIEPNGSGLGLYIVKNIIHHHGGDITIESIPYRGTIFSIALPLSPSP